MLGRQINKHYILISLVIVFLILFHYLGWINSTEFFFRSLFLPSASRIHSWRVSIDDRFFSFEEQKDFLNLNNQYRELLESSKVLEAQNTSLLNENDFLKQQLQFKQKEKYKMITTNVVGGNIDSLERTIIIDAGSSSNISDGDPVIAGIGLLVGVVVKTEVGSSIVRLINDSQSKIAATILNHDQSLGVVEGGYGISVRMSFIPRNEAVIIGDKIITSGLEKNVPRGLLIGEVAAAENEAYQPFQQAILTPSARLDKLTIVSVLLTN